MPVDEDQVASLLFEREIDVATALQLFYDGEVLVYPVMNLDPDEATWDDIADHGGNTSGIFHELAMAGADDADMKEVGIQIQRARDEGRTIQNDD